MIFKMLGHEILGFCVFRLRVRSEVINFTSNDKAIGVISF